MVYQKPLLQGATALGAYVIPGPLVTCAMAAAVARAAGTKSFRLIADSEMHDGTLTVLKLSYN